MRRLIWPLGFAAALGCVDAGVRPGLTVTVVDSADQVIIGMATRDYVDGVYRTQVLADTAYVYQARGVMDLRNMKAHFFDEQGNQTATLTARFGIYTTTNGSLDARGAVDVVSTDGKRLRTEHLIYDKALLQLKSDTAFIYTSPTENLTGKEFTSDLEFKNVDIVQPKGFQKGEGVALPNR
ncbi:MAG: LPS export ABC transporter periplasmic protein LptC [Gemmatimonadales bacterium]